jgi:hypothetical protein
MCSLWKKDDLWAKPALVEKGYQANFPPKFAGCQPE